MNIRVALSGFCVISFFTLTSLGQNDAAPSIKPATMKAVCLHAHNNTPEAVRFDETPKPTPKAGQVLIRVHAAGVIPGDWKTRDGRFGDLSQYMPLVLGYDVSGVVESVGEGVETFKEGDEVFGYLSNGGAFAEYAVGSERELARKPPNITHEEAAGAPVSALAAWYALVQRAKLQEGQTVLIQAGAGGVGHYAVQIAHAIGATVYTTASPRNHEFLRELGADVVIDYNTERFEDVVDDVDVVFDMIGGEVLERSYTVVKPGGYLVAITSKLPQEKLDQYGIRGSFLATPANGKALAKVAELMASGKVKTHVSATFPLSETAAAMDLNEKGHTRGKIVITVQ